MASTRITVRLTDAAATDLEVCMATGWTQAEAVRTALDLLADKLTREWQTGVRPRPPMSDHVAT